MYAQKLNVESLTMTPKSAASGTVARANVPLVPVVDDTSFDVRLRNRPPKWLRIARATIQAGVLLLIIAIGLGVAVVTEQFELVAASASTSDASAPSKATSVAVHASPSVPSSAVVLKR